MSVESDTVMCCISVNITSLQYHPLYMYMCIIKLCTIVMQVDHHISKLFHHFLGFLEEKNMNTVITFIFQ